jgi:LAO/AO transport system kinase
VLGAADDVEDRCFEQQRGWRAGRADGHTARVAATGARGHGSAPADELAARVRAGDRRALARAISLVEDDREEGWELVRELYGETGRSAVQGFTGPPGAGKSTLIGALTSVRRRAGRTVGVLSIDPSSPFTEGALLGDRIRLSEHFLDQGVFIRSMASRGAVGGLAEAALQACLLLDAAGREEIFVETVGVGQGEVDIVDHADTVVLVLMPGSGDAVQALKAGIMEIPDVIVVNKADHPLADTLVREIRGVLALGNLDGRGTTGWRVPVLKTVAARGDGVEALAETLDEHRGHIVEEGLLEGRRRRNLAREVLALATARIRRELEASARADGRFERLLDEVAARRTDPASAAAALLARRRPGRAQAR